MDAFLHKHKGVNDSYRDVKIYIAVETMYTAVHKGFIKANKRVLGRAVK